MSLIVNRSFRSKSDGLEKQDDTDDPSRSTAPAAAAAASVAEEEEAEEECLGNWRSCGAADDAWEEN